MRKFFKILLFSLLLYVIFSLGKIVDANSIRSIDMDIYIDNDGDANVTETWRVSANSGTEMYHPYYNLGTSAIENLSVSLDSTQYTTLSSWNTSGSLSSKAYKAGINRISNGVELCWGISEYGSNTYTVKYTISNFVVGLKDSQMIYWTLIPYDFSNKIGQVEINIYSNFNIPNSTDVWGYGNYGGLAYVDNGVITMASDGTLDTDEYMTILVKFPEDTFNVQTNLNRDFQYYLDMAEEGANHYSSSSNFATIILLLPVMFVSLLPIFLTILKSVSTGNESRLAFEKKSNKLPRNKDIPYYRDIPCNKDLFLTFFIAYQFKIVKKKTDLLGSILLKWVRDKKVTIKKDAEKPSKMSIIFNKELGFSLENVDEQDLYNMFLEASKDGILEDSEFKKWCNINYSKILKWFDNILDREKIKLVNNGLLLEKPKTLFCQAKYTATPEIRQHAINIAGLKKYLKDYTLISEREAPDVVLFEDYLIVAQMLGIADKVADNFKKLYPDLIEQTNFDSYNTVTFVHLYAIHGINSAYSAQRAAASRYSGGGGGFSSGGGGGGSFGGGGGGGGFR